MNKVIVMLFILSISTTVLAQHTDNPGYVKSPGFVVASFAVTDHEKNSKDGSARPNIFGMINLFQSEYGNIALSLGIAQHIPKQHRQNNNINYRLTAEQISTEMGLYYTTGSKTINFWLGGGVSNNYIDLRIDSVKNSAGSHSGFHKSSFSNQFGWQYYIGGDYRITKDGKWGLIVQIKGQYTNSPTISYNHNINFNDGSNALFAGESKKNVNVNSYSFGISYHF